MPLLDRLVEIKAKLSELRPDPEPPQETRVGEAAAAQVDMQKIRAWHERQQITMRELTQLLPEIIDAVLGENRNSLNDDAH